MLNRILGSALNTSTVPQRLASSSRSVSQDAAQKRAHEKIQKIFFLALFFVPTNWMPGRGYSKIAFKVPMK